MGSLSPLQGIFLTKESNQGLLHCRQILYQLSYQGSPRVVSFWGHWEWVHSRPRSWFWWLSPILDFYRHQFSLWRGYMHHLCLLMTFFPKCLQFFYKDNKSYWFRTHSSLIWPHFNIIFSYIPCLYIEPHSEALGFNTSTHDLWWTPICLILILLWLFLHKHVLALLLLSLVFSFYSYFYMLCHPGSP